MIWKYLYFPALPDLLKPFTYYDVHICVLILYVQLWLIFLMEWMLITFSLKNRSYRAFSFHSKYIYFCTSLSKILTKLTTPSTSHITYVKTQSPSKTIKKLYKKKLPSSNMLQVSMLHNPTNLVVSLLMSDLNHYLVESFCNWLLIS